MKRRTKTAFPAPAFCEPESANLDGAKGCLLAAAIAVALAAALFATVKYGIPWCGVFG